MCDLQHRAPSLVNPVQRIVGVEVDAPPTRMLDRYHVISENHFWRCNAQALGHLLNGLGLQNR